MHALTRQLKAAQALYDNAHEDDAQRYEDARAKRADAAEHAMPRVMYADAMREWAGMEERRSPVFHVIEWQEGDPF